MNLGKAVATGRVVTLLSFLLLGGCVTDQEQAQVVPFSVDTSGQNNPPAISGIPLTVISLGDNYTFTPTANDADGNTLTFSVQNLPNWASFDTSTGQLAGQPTLGHVGVYQKIIISVSDGVDSASLPQFNVTVTQTSLGSSTLSWTAPTQNTDGSPLMDLAGYNIYYGTSTGTYQNAVRINNPGIATFVVEDLAPDTYYFALTAFNAGGVESSYSNEAIKAVN